MRKLVFPSVALWVVVCGLAQVARAQTPFERLFDPRSSLHIILEISQADWTSIVNEMPFGNVLCDFSTPPTTNRFTWRTHDITIATEWAMTSNQQTYDNAGVK